jgi:hypothetical protein
MLRHDFTSKFSGAQLLISPIVTIQPFVKPAFVPGGLLMGWSAALTRQQPGY